MEGSENVAKKKKRLLTLQAICSTYGLKKKDVEKMLPEASVRTTAQNGNQIRLWTVDQVEDMLAKPAAHHLRARQKEAMDAVAIRSFLLGFGLDGLRRTAEQLQRTFVLHIGPTNSGKTYQALQALARCGRGVYLGPLRLLALEVFD